MFDTEGKSAHSSAHPWGHLWEEAKGLLGLTCSDEGD